MSGSTTMLLAGINADIAHMKAQKERLEHEAKDLAELTEQTQNESLSFAEKLDEVCSINEHHAVSLVSHQHI
jgi:archaellum component FlaC